MSISKQVGKMNNKWWGDSNNAKDWIEQNQKRAKSNNGDNTTELSTEIFQNEIVNTKFKKSKDKFKTVLEVGSGDGRLIGPLSKKYKKIICNAVDVNDILLEYIDTNWSDVRTYKGNITELPFKDNEFDLVYTYQVIQHIHPEDIQQALQELIRVGKEIWMFEGIGTVDYKNGSQTHKAHDGSWVWKIDEMINISDIEVKVPEFEGKKLERQRLYKVRKK